MKELASARRFPSERTREFAITMKDSDSIPTRQCLLARLKDVGDQESWREFFDTYWRLVHATAFKAGLTDSASQEVAHEVMIAAAKKMPEFT